MNKLISQAEIIQVLQGFNPWWSGRSFPVPVFRRLAYTAAKSYLDEPSFKRAILLSGPRRVGKTIILHQVANELIKKKEPKGVFYISLDHPLLRLLSLSDILRLYHDNIHPEDRSCVLLLDEIQYATNWDVEIKLLVDHQPNVRILSTGSASAIHKDHLSESGVGRWITIPVPTLSFYEFVHIRHDPVPQIDQSLRPRNLFNLSPSDRTDLIMQCRLSI